MQGGYFSEALVFLVETVFGILVLILMLRFILQLVRADFYNPISQFVIKATQPLLTPLRRIIPGLGGLDMASVVAMVLMQWLELVITNILIGGAPGSVAFANLPLFAVAALIELAIFLFTVTVIVQALLSWFSPGNYGPGAALLYSLNEPLLRPMRRVMPPFGGMDLSPLVVLVLLQLALILVVAPIKDIAVRI